MPDAASSEFSPFFAAAMPAAEQAYSQFRRDLPPPPSFRHAALTRGAIFAADIFAITSHYAAAMMPPRRIDFSRRQRAFAAEFCRQLSPLAFAAVTLA